MANSYFWQLKSMFGWDEIFTHFRSAICSLQVMSYFLTTKQIVCVSLCMNLLSFVHQYTYWSNIWKTFIVLEKHTHSTICTVQRNSLEFWWIKLKQMYRMALTTSSLCVCIKSCLCICPSKSIGNYLTNFFFFATVLWVNSSLFTMITSNNKLHSVELISNEKRELFNIFLIHQQKKVIK